MAKSARQFYKECAPVRGWEIQPTETNQVNNLFLKLYAMSQGLKDNEQGQDMVEPVPAPCRDDQHPKPPGRHHF